MHILPVVQAEYTSDLIVLLNVLGRLVQLEPAQAAFLDEILDRPLIAADQFAPPAGNGGP